MKTNKIDFETAKQLHKTGQFEKAKAGYLAILRINPRNPDVLHSLGVLAIQQKNFQDAMDYLQQAIQYQPNDPSITLNLANVLKLQGLFNQAIQLLENTLQTYPDYAPAINNLGTLYYAKGQFDQAIQYYRQAITKQPEYIDAYYNLGLAQTKNNQLDESIQTYQKILSLASDHMAARFHLACAHMQKNQITIAMKEFLAIEKDFPHHFETQSNLASCYLQQGALEEAKKHYLKALALQQNDTQILFNLGVICMQQGYIDSAIQYYQSALQINSAIFEAQNNIAVALLGKQHLGLALEHFNAALKIQPNNKAVAYTIEVLSKNKRLLAAPPDYITALFDGYADHYESHLLQALDYDLPQILHSALKKLLPAYPLDIADLGCGTGLCGAVFKPVAKTLIGVDLSNKMLEIAAEKNLYDELITTDFISFLKEKHQQFDLLLAGDVLVYMGDLESTFEYAAMALRDKGLFAFNTEITDSHDFKMNQSGRFSHNKSYIEELATRFHFTILSYQKETTRMQNNEPVKGHIYVMQRV